MYTIRKKQTRYGAIIQLQEMHNQLMQEEKLKSPSPICYFSYANNTPEEAKWTKQLALDLLAAGIDIIYLKSGFLGRNAGEIQKNQRVSADVFIVVGSDAYSLQSKTDVLLVNDQNHMFQSIAIKPIPIILNGNIATAFNDWYPVNSIISSNENYYDLLFTIIGQIYNLSDDPTLAKFKEQIMTMPEPKPIKNEDYYETFFKLYKRNGVTESEKSNSHFTKKGPVIR